MYATRVLVRKIWEIGPQNVYFLRYFLEIDISQVCYQGLFQEMREIENQVYINETEFYHCVVTYFRKCWEMLGNAGK